MRNLFLYLCLSLFLFACNNKKAPKKETIEEKPVTVVTGTETNQTSTIDVPTMDYKGLKPILNQSDDKVYVINFWATWCAPCVKELPYFEKVNQDYKDKNLEVILVSLDFPKMKETKLIPFIEKKNLQSRIIHFDDIDEQFWIADIDESLSGALPATLIYTKDKRKFFEKSFTQEELENEIQSFIN